MSEQKRRPTTTELSGHYPDIEDDPHGRKELERLQQERDATWEAIQNAFDIEPREFFEAEAPKNGFKYALCQAVHHMWKRDPRVADLQQQLTQLRADYEAENNRRTEAEGRILQLREGIEAIQDLWKGHRRVSDVCSAILAFEQWLGPQP